MECAWIATGRGTGLCDERTGLESTGGVMDVSLQIPSMDCRENRWQSGGQFGVDREFMPVISIYFRTDDYLENFLVNKREIENDKKRGD